MQMYSHKGPEAIIFHCFPALEWNTISDLVTSCFAVFTHPLNKCLLGLEIWRSCNGRCRPFFQIDRHLETS